MAATGVIKGKQIIAKQIQKKKKKNINKRPALKAEILSVREALSQQRNLLELQSGHHKKEIIIEH